MSPSEIPDGISTLPEPQRSAVTDDTPGAGLTTPPEVDQRTSVHIPAEAPGTVVQIGVPLLLGNPDWPTVPGHQITGEIAKGGMGIVFAAYDVTLKREVAIKTLLPELAGHSHLAEQFDRESRITAQLPHPGVPPVHAIGTLPDGRPFLVMKLIRGRTLDAELRATDRATALPRLLSVFEQICHTVGYAHSVGIIHRDLKPLNVMVGAFGEVQVMDWGIARSGVGIQGSRINGATTQNSDFDTTDSESTRAGSAKGTPSYMPPEQARGEWEKVDARADVFGLGGILCTMLTGKPVYTGADGRAIFLKAQTSDRGEVLSRLDECRADAELISLCKRCLSVEPADRPADGKALAEAIAAYRTGVEERARQADTQRATAEARAAEETNTRREAEARADAEKRARQSAEAEASEQRKRRRIQLVLGLAVGLILLSGGAFVWWREHIADQARFKQVQFNMEMKLKSDHARDRVRSLLGLADQARSDYRYQAAEQNIAEAGELAAQFAPDIAPQVEQANSDLAFVRELDAIRMQRSTYIWGQGGKGHFDEAKAPDRYRAAFLARGLNVVADSDAVGTQVAASRVRADIVGALDDWATLEPDGVVRDKLFAAARRADPDSGSNLFRDPAVWTDKTSLQALVAKADVARMSPGAVVAVAGVMWKQRLDPAPLLRHALSVYPRDFLIAFSLGLYRRGNDGRRPEAIGAFRAARAIRSDNTTVLNNLGNNLLDSGDLFGAVAAFNEAIRIDPNFAGAHTNLGSALHFSGDLPGAIAAHKKALLLDPKFASAHANLGFALESSGDLPGAIAAHEKVLRLDPKNTMCHNNLGNALQTSGDLSGAVVAYKEAIRIDPKFTPAYTNLGNTLQKLGDVSGAAAAFNKAIQLEPNNTLAQKQLAWLLATGPLDVRNAQLAIKVAARAYDLSGYKEAGVLETLAAAHAEAGAFDKAIEYQEKALSHPELVIWFGAEARKRLALYRDKKPYRDPTLVQIAVTPPPGVPERVTIAVGRRWLYLGGQFIKTEQNSWVEEDMKGTKQFMEVTANIDFVELYDATRDIGVRLHAGRMDVKLPRQVEYRQYRRGAWAPALEAAPSPRPVQP